MEHETTEHNNQFKFEESNKQGIVGLLSKKIIDFEVLDGRPTDTCRRFSQT